MEFSPGVYPSSNHLTYPIDETAVTNNVELEALDNLEDSEDEEQHTNEVNYAIVSIKSLLTLFTIRQICRTKITADKKITHRGGTLKVRYYCSGCKKYKYVS